VLAGTQQLSHELELRITGTLEPLGAGGPGPLPVQPADLEAAAALLEEQALDTKLPFGSAFEMLYRDPYDGSWEDSLHDPSFTLVPEAPRSIERSAERTGLLLAALAFRYGETRSPATLGEVGATLQATRVLLTMKGQPGNLNRMILPRAAFSGPLDENHYVVRFAGTDYLASDYISRDDYFGLLFGLITAYDRVDDPDLRAEAGLQVELAADHLLTNGWTWRKRDGSFGERWQGVLEQQYAWLLAAVRVNPAKYGALRQQYRGFADLLWLRAWIAVMDPHGGHQRLPSLLGALHLVLRLETDPVRWQRAYQAMAILRHHIGHHQNALFNAFYLASDPASRPHLGAENQNLLAALLRQPRRKIVVDVSNDPTIEGVLRPAAGSGPRLPGLRAPRPGGDRPPSHAGREADLGRLRLVGFALPAARRAGRAARSACRGRVDRLHSALLDVARRWRDSRPGRRLTSTSTWPRPRISRTWRRRPLDFELAPALALLAPPRAA
jgi:hypothetical protein